jgi:exodeoxyribonuclease VII large subunit
LCGQRLKTILAAAMFRNPLLIVQNREQSLDGIHRNLSISAKTVISQIYNRLQKHFEQLLKIEPQRLISGHKIALNSSASRLSERLQNILAGLKINLETLAAKVIACNPKSVLNRGYSIAKNAITGKVVTSSMDINIGDLLITELANEKTIESKVTKK